MELALAEWPKLSDREIARICAVSHIMVADVRPGQLEDSSSLQPATRIGKDGKERKMPVKAVVTAPAQSAPIPESKPANAPRIA